MDPSNVVRFDWPSMCAGLCLAGLPLCAALLVLVIWFVRRVSRFENIKLERKGVNVEITAVLK